ncbi:MAG: response regulator [Treponema sp.]|jgi:two-component system cell cycle response regulator|nr:response regulator [Treponema sp.]
MSKVIHVDNSEFFRKLMKTFLSELGLESESFERGEDAVNVVNGGEVSFVITGLALADMSGEELIKRIIASSRPVPVITVTSNDETAQAKRLGALGVKANILKSGNWKDQLRDILG